MGYAITIIADHTLQVADKNWKQIWEALAPYRYRAFLWLARHGSFLCNHVRVRRLLAASDACTACGDEMETCLHVLRDCGKAKEVWGSLQPPIPYQDF